MVQQFLEETRLLSEMTRAIPTRLTMGSVRKPRKRADPDVEVVEDEDAGNLDVVEAAEPKVKETPLRPTEEMVALHMKTRYPRVSWCPQCIREAAKMFRPESEVLPSVRG